MEDIEYAKCVGDNENKDWKTPLRNRSGLNEATAFVSMKEETNKEIKKIADKLAIRLGDSNKRNI